MRIKPPPFAKIVLCTLITPVDPPADNLVVRVEGTTPLRGSALVAAHLIAARLSAALGNAYAAPHVSQGDLNTAFVTVEWGKGGRAPEARAAIVGASEWLIAQSPIGFFPTL